MCALKGVQYNSNKGLGSEFDQFIKAKLRPDWAVKITNVVF